MNISYNWLKQFINIDWDARQTAELLTDLGLEVEGISAFESIKGGLKGVVVGEVISCIQHPNADRLKLTKVDIGTKEPLQIVCGAPNVATGQKVPVATVGTTLFKDGEPWIIKKGKIRGEESFGMICAEDELGLGTDHDGILVLDDASEIGSPCSSLFDIENDEVFEIGLTPNRSDAMSHFGVARDLRAGLRQKEVEKELITPPLSNFNISDRSLKIAVSVADSTLTPRYCGVTISNLVVKPSPTWLQNRLNAIGIAPKNNLVDATNYVLHELGQPLHAFDADKIKGKEISVKTLPKGTKFITLDGVERELHEEDLMICDKEKPMCIAGVFGGIHSAVSDQTTSIFLESAYFDPISIRKTAKRHGLNTDASFRFERGIDIENTEFALRRTAILITEIAGGDITSDIIDLYPKKVIEKHVFLSFEKTNKLIGQEIPKDTIKAILSSLDIKVMNITESGLGLMIPSYRVDVQRDVDVIEEVLRVYGYNNVLFTQKLNASIATTSKFEDYKLQNIAGNLLAAKGFFEIMANSLSNPNYIALSKNLKESENVTMMNPLSTDLSVLRQSMLFSGLSAISHNINRKRENLKLFEFGKTYHKYGEKHIENKHLSLFLTGNRNEENWESPSHKTDFYLLKTMSEMVLSRLGITNFQSIPQSSDGDFSEGLILKSNKKEIAVLGIVKKSISKAFDIKQEVFYSDFNWNNILSLICKTNIVYKEIPKYPEVKRDFALLLDTHVTYKEVYDLAFQTEKKILKSMQLFDVYTGKNLPEGKKSYAVSFTLLDENSTLTDKRIDKTMNKLKMRFEKELAAELR